MYFMPDFMLKAAAQGFVLLLTDSYRFWQYVIEGLEDVDFR